MTLKPYTAEMLDQFALRLLDLAATLRGMANRSREFGVEDFALHDKKAGEWCKGLERWVHRSQAELEMKILDQRAEQRAISAEERPEKV